MERDLMFGGHTLIAMLGLLGVVLLIVSIFINNQVVHYTQQDERHKEKQLEYYRNTFSQLGVILLGIGVSLFIFFFQQGYLERQRRDSQTQELLGKLGVRLSRAAPLMESVAEIDPVLDDGGPYLNPEDGGSNRAVTATGSDLAKQVETIRLLERDIDLGEFSAMEFSNDFQSSPLVNQIDPNLWFSMVKDESELRYAAEQLRQDYGDVQAALGDHRPDEVVSDPRLADAVKREVLDVLWDYGWLRDRSRRLVGRACWFLSEGPKFLSLKPIPAVEARYDSHHAWLQQAQKVYERVSFVGENCYAMLKVAEQP